MAMRKGANAGIALIVVAFMMVLIYGIGPIISSIGIEQETLTSVGESSKLMGANVSELTKDYIVFERSSRYSRKTWKVVHSENETVFSTFQNKTIRVEKLDNGNVVLTKIK